MTTYYHAQRISERISTTPQGFLLCQDVPIARTGQQDYLASEIGLDGRDVVTVNRDEAEVFSPATLASFEGITVTLQHPREQITADNWRQFAHGHLQNVRRGEGEQAHLILGDMLITDPSTIIQVKGGLREVSCGYDCAYVQDAEGQWHQTEIRGNHVAIVPRGRAGPECSIKDSIMSKAMDAVRKIFGKAQDEALAALAAVPPGDVTPPPAATKGYAVDAAGKVTIAADADMASIIADLMERLMYMERCKVEADETVAALKEAIAKLQAGDPTPAADALPVAVTDADTIARAEILAPGCAKVTGVELAALTACYATDAGKKVIDLLNGGKAPTADTAPGLFVSASELIKLQRGHALQTPAAKAVVSDAEMQAAFKKKADAMFPVA